MCVLHQPYAVVRAKCNVGVLCSLRDGSYLLEDGKLNLYVHFPFW